MTVLFTKKTVVALLVFSDDTSAIAEIFKKCEEGEGNLVCPNDWWFQYRKWQHHHGIEGIFDSVLWRLGLGFCLKSSFSISN